MTMNTHVTEPFDPAQREWDVIVVGTGMGGATIGHALAKAGKSVLFCERGKSHLTGNAALTGDYAENYFPKPEYPQPKHREVLLRAGRWPDAIEDWSSPRPYRFMPFIGSGTGGSSALYGMAMERFHPSDFAPGAYHSDALESSLPESWPINYNDLRPYYEAAERLFRVRGTGDSLRKNEPLDHYLPPPPLSPYSQELYDFFKGKGLHPYRLPMACEYAPGCEGCQGYLCDRDCKNDSARICLEPALKEFGARLLDECEVLKIEATRTKITGLQCSLGGRSINLRAKVVILAGGALETPRILLNSASSTWPNGVANDSGQVGKNLMRHYIDLYAVFMKTGEKFSGNVKEIAFNDLYIPGGQKFGTVQSFGPMLPPAILAAGAEKDLRNGALPWAGSLFKLVRPAAKAFFAGLFSRAIILATIMEDLPYEENLVMQPGQTDSRLIIKYQIHEREHSRIKSFREEVGKILNPYRFMLIKQAENNERIAHACGTCRFGHNPEESVLDATNRAHRITNLYVVDGSFFPSSGGTNPALTIAANALRVADHLIATWGNV